MDSSAAAWHAAASRRRRLTPPPVLPPEVSLAQHAVSRLTAAGKVQEFLDGLEDGEIFALAHDLDFWARGEQIPPATAWELCVFLAGRGWGKSFAGAKWAIGKAQEGRSLGILVGPTAAAIRDQMVYGSSGILALSPPWFMPRFEPSKRRLTWPNGINALCFSADKPDSLRGPNAGWAWCDEICAWSHDMAAWDQLPLVVRIGDVAHPPQTLVTTTPRPFKKLQDILARPGTIVRTGSSLNNAANLAPSAIREMRAMAQTRWGRQEVLGELLFDVPGAIFSSARWSRVDVDPLLRARQMDRIIIAMDPAPTSELGADETGMVVMGIWHTSDSLAHVSVLDDLSCRASPREWATTAIKAYIKYGAQALVVEVNSGGELVEETIRTVAAEMGWADRVFVKPVRAREAKSKRAEPVSALAESGRIEIVGNPEKLLKQLTTFTGINGRRDDRCDAVLWGTHELVLQNQFWAI